MLRSVNAKDLRSHDKENSVGYVQSSIVASTSNSQQRHPHTPQQICLDSVRAALLDTIPSYIAYSLRPKICEWNEDGEILQIVVEINCEKDRVGRVVLGNGGWRVTEIGRRVNDHMHNLFTRQFPYITKHKEYILAQLQHNV
ncbi:hypothetical protein DICVIV_11783 [Dictyocaulus viviparus]|uniref:KH domain protein n=1 Tax=Dictyocaulus viviparus TaxID=29172 RepID=A0A0D8XIU0_DICVI|nr:hypothetical protein DICVIV_11783 [Dictyocaulus viviparus]